MLPRFSACILALSLAAAAAVGCADLSRPHEISVVKPAPPRPADSAAPAASAAHHPAKAE